MKPAWLPAFISGTLVCVVLGYLIATGNWNVAGIWIEPSVIGWPTGFADLASLTGTADCVRAGTDVTTCDPYGRPFQPYAMLPSALLVALGLGLAETGWLGVGLAVVYAVVVSALVWAVARTWTRSTWEFLGAAAIIVFTSLTPPALLGVERGQPEILVLAAAVIGLAFTGRPRKLTSFLGATALFFSAILKYFNLGTFVAFLAPKRWSWWAAGSMIATALFLFANWTDVQIAQQTAGASGPSTSRVMFGAQTPWVTLVTEDPAAFFAPDDADLPLILFRIGSLVLIALLTLCWWFTLKRTNAASIQRTAWSWLIGGIGAVALPFVLGNSNDYRLILLLPAMAGAFLWLGHNGPSAQLWLVTALIALASATNAWMIPNSAGWLMPKFALLAGDLALMAVIAFGIALFIRAWVPRAARPSA